MPVAGHAVAIEHIHIVEIDAISQIVANAEVLSFQREIASLYVIGDIAEYVRRVETLVGLLEDLTIDVGPVDLDVHVFNLGGNARGATAQ